jgi:hypothetical protein
MTYEQLEDSFLGTLHTNGTNTPENTKNHPTEIKFGNKDKYLCKNTSITFLLIFRLEFPILERLK